MIPSDVVFVTSNAGKVVEASDILGFPLRRLDLDLPETQGLDVLAIARDKARRACAAIGAAVLVEDTSLELAALGGFPGPLVRWLLTAAGPAAIPRLLAGFPDRRATARCAAVITDGSREWFGVGEDPGTVVESPRGEGGFGWDVVFAPAWGGGLTYAELPPEQKNARSHRRHALMELARSIAASR
jgi:non-canonical purine NTP pyrophosphatase (RdgB/HAM1 family)